VRRGFLLLNVFDKNDSIKNPLISDGMLKNKMTETLPE